MNLDAAHQKNEKSLHYSVPRSQTNESVYTSRLNCRKFMSGCRRELGRLSQTRGLWN